MSDEVSALSGKKLSMCRGRVTEENIHIKDDSNGEEVRLLVEEAPEDKMRRVDTEGRRSPMDHQKGRHREHHTTAVRAQAIAIRSK